MTKFSLVIPCYNEAANIPLIVERFGTRPGVELILVDNGSTDETPKVLERLKKDGIRSIRVPVNQGYGRGILEGLRAAEGEFLGWTHGDVQTDPRDALEALELIEAHPTPRSAFIKGMRFGRPLFDRFFTFGMSVFETLYLGKNLNDINAQPNVFHRFFFETWSDPPEDFSLDLYAFYMARLLDFHVVRFPVKFQPRAHGVSHWNRGLASKLRFIGRTLSYSVKLKRRLS